MRAQGLRVNNGGGGAQALLVRAQETSYGLLRPPLGSVRLTIIELVAVLLRSGSAEGEAAAIASGVLAQILAIFLHFPFNSILHHQVRGSKDTHKRLDP